MNYRVEWLQEALDQLAEIWLQASSAERTAIVAATSRIDLLLRTNPHGIGESRPNRRRIAFVLTLTIIFRVEPDDKTVTILEVRFVRGSTP